VGQAAGQGFLVGVKLRLLLPQNAAVGVQPAAPHAEHQAGGLAVAVALKLDAAVQVEQQAVAEMGLQLLLVAAPASRARKLGGIGGHGSSPFPTGRGNLSAPDY